MTSPIVIIHRRNRINELSSVPRGCWIEIDVDFLDGEACLSHDPATKAAEPELLADFLPRAIERGITGFIFDCKRENVETSVQPFIAKYEITDYFYLNEMEIQADTLLTQDPSHRSAMRIWCYRSARDFIRYIEDMKIANRGAPAWAWIDCWQRELPIDIGKPLLPINQADSHKLRQMGVKLCVCSPELYAHEYGKDYDFDDLEHIYRGVVRYRQRLMQAGVPADAVCTKFPWLWTVDIDLLAKASTLAVT